MNRAAITACACICAALGPPGHLHAQSPLFVRVAPEASLSAVRHTKTVTLGGESSSTSESNGLGLAADIAAGLRVNSPVGWVFGAAVELTVSAPLAIEGPIHPTSTGEPHDVWAGRWEYSDRFGAGAWVLLGRRVGDRGSELNLTVGARRMWSEVLVDGTNPETGQLSELSTVQGHWPISVGLGTTLHLGRPWDIRLNHLRSDLSWSETLPSPRIDHDTRVRAWSLSVGWRTR